MKILLLCLLLSACGGGGSEDPQAPDATVMPVDCAAYAKACT